jgi:UDP-glucose 4-epimerase
MKETIFITGVAGFLGSHLADCLISMGYRVKGNDNLIGGYIDNVPEQCEFFQIDCNDLHSLTDAMADVDIVIHCAATAYEGLSVFSPGFIVNNVMQSSTNVISAAVQNRVKRIVYCSSMARYGNQLGPFVETMTPAPVDPYGIAKVGGEQILKSICEVNNVEWNIAVPHNIIGSRQKYDDPYRNVVSIMINRCLQNKAPVIYGNGTQQRCFSHIDDCIYCLIKLTIDPLINKQTVNIGPDEETISINELADLVIELTGYNGKPIYVESRPLEVPIATCSSNLAKQLLGYNTKTSLRDAIIETLEYIKKLGPRPFEYKFPLEIKNSLTPVTWKNDFFNK